jgi:hypothetical protein
VSASSRNQQQINVVSCQECDVSSTTTWKGWRAYRTDDPETAEPPSIAFYCPACAEREFGPFRADRRADR